MRLRRAGLVKRWQADRRASCCSRSAAMLERRYLRCLTFELTGPRRWDGLARAGKMYCVPQAGPRRPAVGGPVVQRGVRPHSQVVAGSMFLPLQGSRVIRSPQSPNPHHHHSSKVGVAARAWVLGKLRRSSAILVLFHARSR